ncbi:hypothetical protein AB0F81_17950 [Actinoplanes sp. NPDC024001]|uniref:hypothetical protein n=1 Tax=Actinoplanes sp. NPDC024001 TaxID=3154598 RepID=UPI0033D61C33
MYEEALRTIGDAARVYGVEDDSVVRYRARMRECGPLGYAEGGMSSILVRTAHDHRADCTQTVCRTCDGLKAALTVALAGCRELIDMELSGMAGGGEPRRRLRLWHRR